MTRALELFAGIGGLRLALPRESTTAAAYDQDRVAGAVYRQLHGDVPRALDLASVSAKELARHEADLWLLSPPCQPFTSRGRKRDLDDPRAAGLLRCIELLAACRPSRLLLENVPGFLESRAHLRLEAALREIGHETRALLLCPSELGAPVRRRRLFLVSSARGLDPLPSAEVLAASIPERLADYLDREPDPALTLPRERLERYRGARPAPGAELPLATFTRSYGRAITGAGPLLWSGTSARHFSPQEILRLLGFEAHLRLPPDLPLRAGWRLAGNSVHIACVRWALACLRGS